MINPFKEVNWDPDIAARRKFAVSLIIGFPVIAVLLFVVKWLAGGHPHVTALLWLGGGGLAAGAVFWAVPQIAKPFYLAWYFLACSIGIVVSNVLLVGFYFVVVTLLGLLMRALGKAPLRKNFDRNAKTYWEDVPRQTDPTRYYSQF